MWRLRWVVLFLSKVVVGDGQEAWQMLLTTAPHPRHSRLGQYSQKTFVDVFNTKLQHFPTTMPFPITSTITLSCLASAAPQAESCWLGHVEPDDVVIADTSGQALDIVLHGPESAHKNDNVKTFTHTSIPIHPCTLLKQTNSKTLNSPTMTPSFSCHLPVQCAGGRRPVNLAPAPHDCYTSESSSPRTVLTETFIDVFNNIARQQYLL